ncbi:hypothetical protein GS429_19260 [Natronorubrum sp. JWXQ-INN-674]|uniref:Putative heavy-metal chelation domain-containing protein n=1 Tax=Natronorubrum halalkaliphilum TaxID=2691917 RepID=A0A6B0VRU4_9EURY|nr:DUF364 domain-containing protein [Natronorubrum halalkaliphilum]MXV64164.1 hypothetical protein [Natronorubrum halalkaliphilum]
MIDPILPAVVDRLRSVGALEHAAVERVTIGDSVVMVELSGVSGASRVGAETAGSEERTRASGLAHRPPGDSASVAETDLETLLRWASCGPGDTFTDFDEGDGSSGNEDGGEGADGTDNGDATALETALGVATVNALSAPFIDWSEGDPMALVEPSVDTIATVGVFRPAFRKFSDVDVRVIERRDVGAVSAPDGVRVTTFRPSEATAAMADADVVFITGSTFVYGGLERYLEAAPATATVVLIGATASVLPEPTFDAGVDVLAGAAVTDPEGVREAVRAGACGTDLHDAGVRKVYTMVDEAAGLERGMQRRRTDRSDRDGESDEQPNDTETEADQ